MQLIRKKSSQSRVIYSLALRDEKKRSFVLLAGGDYA